MKGILHSVNCSYGDFVEGYDFATIFITLPLIKQIKDIRAIVTGPLKLNTITAFDSTPKWFHNDPLPLESKWEFKDEYEEDMDIGLDCIEMVVDDYGVYWKALIKNEDDQISTAHLTHWHLNNVEKVLTTTKDQLLKMKREFKNEYLDDREFFKACYDYKRVEEAGLDECVMMVADFKSGPAFDLLTKKLKGKRT